MLSKDFEAWLCHQSGLAVLMSSLIISHLSLLRVPRQVRSACPSLDMFNGETGFMNYDKSINHGVLTFWGTPFSRQTAQRPISQGTARLLGRWAFRRMHSSLPWCEAEMFQLAVWVDVGGKLVQK